MNNRQQEVFEQNNTKSKIFRIAARLFAEKGYNGVSMREISQQSRVSKPTLYYYYGSKEGIYQSLLDAGLTYGMGDIDDILQQNVSVKQKLIELLKKDSGRVWNTQNLLNFFSICSSLPNGRRF